MQNIIGIYALTFAGNFLSIFLCLWERMAFFFALLGFGNTALFDILNYDIRINTIYYKLKGL